MKGVLTRTFVNLFLDESRASSEYPRASDSSLTVSRPCSFVDPTLPRLPERRFSKLQDPKPTAIPYHCSKSILRSLPVLRPSILPNLELIKHIYYILEEIHRLRFLRFLVRRSLCLGERLLLAIKSI